MTVRWVVTLKLINGEEQTKARLVARWFEDDTSSLRTDSSTCMKDSVRLLLAVTASNSCSLNSIDIKTAFLRGNPKERELCLRPSKEANQSEKPWRLKKAVYGPSDASLVWYLRVYWECSSKVFTIKMVKRIQDNTIVVFIIGRNHILEVIIIGVCHNNWGLS